MRTPLGHEGESPGARFGGMTQLPSLLWRKITETSHLSASLVTVHA